MSKINATPATDSAGELEEAAASEGLLDNADGGEDGASEDEGDEDLIGTASATGHAMSRPLRQPRRRIWVLYVSGTIEYSRSKTTCRG